MVGPQLQEDLFSILLRFRHHRYAMTADIATVRFTLTQKIAIISISCGDVTLQSQYMSTVYYALHTA